MIHNFRKGNHKSNKTISFSENNLICDKSGDDKCHITVINAMSKSHLQSGMESQVK